MATKETAELEVKVGLETLPVGLRLRYREKGSPAWLADYMELQHELSVPFEHVEKLNRVWTDDKGQRKSVTLDYVGHAQVTARLLRLDPMWSWRPAHVDEQNQPYVEWHGKEGVLWGYVEIGGIEYIGVGNAQQKRNRGDTLKELIGDLLRNATMRRGVALDLWTKIDSADMERDADQANVEEDTKNDFRLFTNGAKTDVMKAANPGGGELKSGQYSAKQKQKGIDLWAQVCVELNIDPDDAFAIESLKERQNAVEHAKAIIAKSDEGRPFTDEAAEPEGE